MTLVPFPRVLHHSFFSYCPLVTILQMNYQGDFTVTCILLMLVFFICKLKKTASPQGGCEK